MEYEDGFTEDFQTGLSESDIVGTEVFRSDGKGSADLYAGGLNADSYSVFDNQAAAFTRSNTDPSNWDPHDWDAEAEPGDGDALSVSNPSGEGRISTIFFQLDTGEVESTNYRTGRFGYFRPSSGRGEFRFYNRGNGYSSGSELMEIGTNSVEIPNGNLDMNGNNITNVAEPDSPSDAATKAYVDSGRLNYSDCGVKNVSKIGPVGTQSISAPSGYRTFDSVCSFDEGCTFPSVDTIEPARHVEDQIRIAFQDSDYQDSTVNYVDTDSNIVDTGAGNDAGDVGGIGDMDGDGDRDIAYRAGPGDLRFVDAAGNTGNTGVSTTMIAGGIGDMDGDGDNDTAYKVQYGGVAFVDSDGNIVKPGTQEPLDIGGVGDVDGDGDQDIAYSVNDDGSDSEVRFVDAAGNIKWTGVQYSDAVGGIGDIDGDGDLDVAFHRNGNLKFVDYGQNLKDTGVNGVDEVGGVGDIDGDGDADIAYDRKFADAAGNVGDSEVTDESTVGGVVDLDELLRNVNGTASIRYCKIQ